ncbi:MAG: PCRF domain-containing protein, partial [Oscillospiraceae bacterium]|nr:PCRF domain-containing protein [Oscillospiraceae bacterium]
MMLEQLQDIEHKYQALQARLSAPETYGDPALVARLNREERELAPVAEAYRAWQGQKERLAQAEGLLGDPELGEIAKEDAALARQELEELERRMKLLLLPSDPDDGKSVILELRAGVGGEESAQFGESLYRMISM